MFELMPFGYRRMATFDPFRDFEEMSRSFWNNERVSAFRTDITEKDNSFILEAELPGFKKEDISIDLTDDRLTISARRGSEENTDENGSFIRRERYYGEFCRSFDLSGIDTEAISAAYNDGVLTLTMPRKLPEKPATRRLEIQ